MISKKTIFCKILFVLVAIICFASNAQAAYEPFEIEAIKVTNTLDSDVNQAATEEFDEINTTPVVTTDPLNDVFTSVATNGVVCIPGTYLVYVSLYHEGGNDNNNPGVEVTVDGVGTGIVGADGYVSNNNGQDEATTTVSDVVRFTTTSKIGFQTMRLAEDGSATAPAGQSIMRIIRVDDNY